jgi:hypothetical protein
MNDKMNKALHCVFNKKVAIILGVAAVAIAFPMLADAQSMGTIMNGVGSQSRTASLAGRDIAGFAGTIIGITGFMTLRNHNDRDGKKKAAIELGSGAGLMGLAYVLNSIGTTAGQTTTHASAILG